MKHTGSVPVPVTQNKTFVITPGTGSTLGSLLLDSENVKENAFLQTDGKKYHYTIYSVNADHTLHAEFSSGIVGYDSEEGVTLYPNPTSGKIELRINNDQLTINNVEVYDVYGKLLQLLPVVSNTTAIDISSYTSGVYFVRLNMETGFLTKKVVKR